jgi:hypothetical protein
MPRSFRLSNQNTAHISFLPHICHMPCPSHSPWFYYLNNIGWGVCFMKLLTVQLSTPLLPLSTKYPLSIPFSNTPSLCSSPNVRHQISHHTNNRQCYSSVYFRLYIFR